MKTFEELTDELNQYLLRYGVDKITGSDTYEEEAEKILILVAGLDARIQELETPYVHPLYPERNGK